MKIVLLLVISLVILVGCSEPATEVTQPDSAKLKKLEARNKVLEAELQTVRQEKANLVEMKKKAVVQATDFANKNYALGIENALLRQRNTELLSQYNKVLVLYQKQYAIQDTTAESMNDQIILLDAEISRLNNKVKKYSGAILAVDDKKCAELDKGLDDEEYSAFYKGWGIWKRKYFGG